MASWVRCQWLDKGMDVWSLAGTKVQSMDTSSKWSECRETNGCQASKWLLKEGSGEGSALQSHGAEVASRLSTSDLDENTPERVR